MEEIRLTGERLVLRTIEENEADKVLDYYIRNKAFLARWEPVRDEKFYTLATQAEQLRRDRAEAEGGRTVRMWILEKAAPERVIGSIALNNIVRGAFQSCHLGYKLDQEKVRRGYMSEALALVVGYAFETLQLHRLEANILPRNKASLRTVEKLGFYHEGLALKYLNINGCWEDHIHMVLRNAGME